MIPNSFKGFDMGVPSKSVPTPTPQGSRFTWLCLLSVTTRPGDLKFERCSDRVLDFSNSPFKRLHSPERQSASGSGSRIHTRGTCAERGLYVRMRKRRNGLQTTSNSNGVLPSRSVPRTDYVGPCGNLRLQKGWIEKRGGKRARVSWLYRTCETTHSELPCPAPWRRGSR